MVKIMVALCFSSYPVI